MKKILLIASLAGSFPLAALAELSNLHRDVGSGDVSVRLE